MKHAIKTFSSFSVKDLQRAKTFYRDVLSLDVGEQGEMGIQLLLPGGGNCYIYPKPNHQPATFTVLNFVVDEIETAMEELERKGIQFLHYNNDKLPQDDKGILRGLSAGMGPDIAWFEDPDGNVLSILQEESV